MLSGFNGMYSLGSLRRWCIFRNGYCQSRCSAVVCSTKHKRYQHLPLRREYIAKTLLLLGIEVEDNRSAYTSSASLAAFTSKTTDNAAPLLCPICSYLFALVENVKMYTLSLCIFMYVYFRLSNCSVDFDDAGGILAFSAFQLKLIRSYSLFHVTTLE